MTERRTFRDVLCAVGAWCKALPRRVWSFCKNLPHTVRTSPNRVLLFAFLVPFLLTWLIYIVKGVWPFGENSVLVLDLNAQYVYFYEEVQDLIREGGSFLYTWQRALGGEFMGMYAYYVASPFTFLVALFPKGMITEAILFITLIKAGMCGLTMAYYLRKRFPAKDDITTLMFSTMYAMSAYAVVQAHNSMWIDELIWLPLLAYGIELLIKKRRCILYTGMLALGLLSSFYIGYMACIFSAFYFFYVYFGDPDSNLSEEKNHFSASFLRMAVSSVVGVLLSAIIVLPAYTSLQFGKSDFTAPDWAFKQNFSFLDLLGKLYPGSYDTVRPEGLPFLYCGLLVLIFLPFFFLSRRIRTQEKIAGGIAIAFFVLSFNLSTVDLVWHGFQFPNWLNYRYSFMLTFFLVVFACRAFLSFDQIKFSHLLAVIVGETLLLLVIQQTSELYDTFGCIWFSLATLAIYLLALRCFYSKSCRRQTAMSFLACLCAIEMFGAGWIHLFLFGKDVGYTTRTHYAEFETLLTPAADFINGYDTSFYRAEKTYQRMKNDTMLLNLNGISNSTSTLDQKALTFLNRLGYCATSNWSMYADGNLLNDSFLGIKYLITDKPLGAPYDAIYPLLCQYDGVFQGREQTVYVYQNPNALSLAFTADPAIKAFVMTNQGDGSDRYESVFDFLNATFTTMLGEDENTPIPFFSPATYTENLNLCDVDINFVGLKRIYATAAGNKTISYKLQVDREDEVCMFIPLFEGYQREVAVEVRVNGVLTRSDSYFGDSTDRILSLGAHSVGDTVEIKLTPVGEDVYLPTTSKYFFYLDDEKVLEALGELKRTEVNITEHSDTRLYGTVTVEEGRTTLMTTIPYDAGWKLYVDGVPTETYRVLDCPLAADLPVGTHTVELVYRPSCFTFGAIATAVGLLSFGALIVVDRRMAKKRHDDFVAAHPVFHKEDL